MITGTPWVPYTRDEIAKIENEKGVYELADGHMETIYIGSSGQEGLRDRLIHYRTDRPDCGIASSATYFRCEVVTNNDAWQARLLEAHQLAHQGRLPVYNHKVTYENLGDMLHRVTTDKPLSVVLDDLKRDILAGGLTMQDIGNSSFQHMFLVLDPDHLEAGTDKPLSALPGVITAQEEDHLSVLQMIRPTKMLAMFQQENLIDVAKHIESIAILSMDEAAA